MLNGGGALNPDGLALDLQFAADKTLTARKGPTPTFTRASSGTFVGSNGLIQSAAINAPRFDHTSAGVCRGLLIEESRTNNLRQSQDLSNTTSWVLVNTTNTQSAVGPDGVTNSASVLNEGTATGEHATYGAFGQNRPVMGAVSCSLSVFISAGTRRYVMLNASDFSNGAGIVIDTQNWTITDAKSVGTGWTYTSSRLTNVSGGWYRAELVFTPPSAAAIIPRIQGTLNPTFTSFSQSYVGTSSTIIAYGIQLEAGSFPTSYIPTVASSVVRSADVCNITGTSFSNIFNLTEGSLFAAHYQYGANTYGNIFMAARTDDSGKIQIARSSSTQAYLSIKDDANFERFIYTPSLPVGVMSKSAIAYKINDSIGSVNNVLSPLDTSVTLGTPIQFLIGRDTVGAGRHHNGAIAAIRYYRKRLPNAKLQALTV